MFSVVAITGKGPVVATDLKMLRFFSFTGRQIFIESVPGPIVSIVGSNDYLFLVYHQGAVFHGM